MLDIADGVRQTEICRVDDLHDLGHEADVGSQQIGNLARIDPLAAQLLHQLLHNRRKHRQLEMLFQEGFGICFARKRSHGYARAGPGQIIGGMGPNLRLK